MLSGVDAIQVAIVVAVLAAVVYVYSAGGGQWYDVLSERFVYGVPWGTLVSVVGVVAFYLFAQSGLTHWASPAVAPFRNWSYGYPLGLFSSGFAHAGPNHLIGNMVGTVVLAPLVEFAWSHYPPTVQEAGDRSYLVPPPAATDETGGVTGYSVPDEPRLRDRPWVRALVVFPAAVFVVSILTSLLALGWSLGFSGTVFAFAGFAVVYAPLAGIVATVGLTGVATVVTALREPVLEVSTDPGAPSPPSWAGINVQAHMLGFLIGVFLAFALLRHRNESRTAGRTFLAVAVFAFARGLWSIALSGDGVWRQYRGIGTIFVIALSIMITAAVTGKEGGVPNPLSWLPFDESRPTVVVVWVALVGAATSLLVGAELTAGTADPVIILLVMLVALALVGPPLGAVTPDIRSEMPVTNRQIILAGLVLVTLVVAAPSILTNGLPMDDDPVPETATVEIEDYHVTYAEDATHGRVDSNESGVIVVSERRDIWSTAVDKNQLAHSGEATVVVGGVGWRQTVTANRTGWEVTGGETAYIVDLEHDGELTRAFTSEAAEADVRVAGQTVAVVPGDDEFRLNVTRDGAVVGEMAIPEVNESAAVGALRFSTEPTDDSVAVYAEQDGTRVRIATREEF